MNNESHQRAKRAWSAAQKLQILKEGISAATTLSAVCAQYEIKLPQFYQW